MLGNGAGQESNVVTWREGEIHRIGRKEQCGWVPCLQTTPTYLNHAQRLACAACAGLLQRRCQNAGSGNG